MGSGWSKVKNLFWQSVEEEDDGSDGSEKSDRNEVAEALETLRDLQGVIGSLAIDRSGAVRGADMPRMFDAQAIDELARRMLDLSRMLEAGDTEPMSGSLEFEGHSFHIKGFASGVIGVLFDESAQKPALGMALNLVSRRVATTLLANDA